MENKENEGKKFDQGKVGLHLLPFTGLLEVAKVLDFGAKKYDPWNWTKGMAWSRLLGAAFRHLFKYATGEDKDEETGLSHLAHASCCILFLLEYSLHSRGEDDRFKWPVEKKENLSINSCIHTSYELLYNIQKGLVRCGKCKCLGVQHTDDSGVDWLF